MNILEKAHVFLQAHGREIDLARFDYHFGGAPVEKLLAALERYQNPDGGFSGLEVDIAAPQSHPFAMELALLICLQAGAPKDHPLLQKAIAHLEATQDADGGWRFTPEIYQHPLAPWFYVWAWPNLNPACTLAGLLIELGFGPANLLANVEKLFQQLNRLDGLADGEFYDVRPYAYYFLPEWEHPQRDAYRAALKQWLVRQHTQNKLDGTHFFEYIRSPRTYIGQSIPPHILNAHLDMLQHEQAADGGWPTPYNPFWRPWITVNNLLVLQSFERL
ncbi:MAG: prenyltransferase/squalene oxidase repeat-containing protein [Chloroflexota bacterium]